MNANEMHDPADPETPTRDLRRDIGGLVLFALAIFLGVSVVMAARRPDPAAGGTTAFFMGLVAWLGVWPPIVLSACLGVLGARLWIAGAAERLVRNAAWSVVLALAFALLLSAVSAGAGGTIGDFTGGNLTGVLSPWGGVPLALVVVAGVAWFGWLRPPEWKPVLSPGEPDPSIYTPTDSEGLTADEAEALLPEQITGRSIPVAPDLPPLYPPDVRREGLIPEGARALEPRDEPAPRILPDAPAAPALADAPARVPVQPLAQPAGGLAHQAAALAVQPAAQPPAAPVGGSALADLAPGVPRWERPRPLDAAAAAPESAPAVVPPAGAGFHISVLPVRSAWESQEEADEAAAEGEVDAQASLPVPVPDAGIALEQQAELEDDDADEIEDELSDDEQAGDEEDQLEGDIDDDAEVLAQEDEDSLDDEEQDSDAPLEVAAASLTRLDARPAEDAGDAIAAVEDDDELEAELDDDGFDEDDGADLDDEEVLEVASAARTTAAASVADDDEEDAWSDDGDAEVLAVAAEDAPLAADPELAADVAAAALGTPELATEAPHPSRPGWEQGGLFDDEPVDAYGTPMTLVEALRQANEETSARLETTESEPGPDLELEARAEPEAEALAVEPEPVAEVAAPVEFAEEIAAIPEPDVELQPQARSSSPKPPKTPKTPKAAKPEPSAPAAIAGLEPNDDLVFRAGMLFLERGRVAVSMLQRSFDLDFKEATALLDQLQQAGLIGPYLGGQKRDILLSADEWRGRRVGATAPLRNP